MMHLRRIVAALLLCGVVGASSCNKDSITPPPPGGGGTNGGPFKVFDVFLRPISIERPAPSGSLPSAQVAQHYLTAFATGGTTRAVYNWTVPAALGTLVPKTAALTIHDASVALQLPAPSTLALGFYDIKADGTNGAETGSFTRRFAVIENRWMKSARIPWADPEPDDPTQSPTFFGNEILFVEAPSANNTNLLYLHAFAPLDGALDSPLQQVLQVSEDPPGNNFPTAPKLFPDVAPASTQRAEIVFASRMDNQYPERCPNGGSCGAPLNLWVVHSPQLDGTTFKPRQMTFDSTFTRFGSTLWYAFNFSQPRWDPTASGSDARIGFLSNVSHDVGGNDLWTGSLRDRHTHPEARSDTLVNYHRLTTTGGVAGFDWHPDGTRIVVAVGGGLSWVDAATGAVSAIALPDSDLARILSPTVYWQTGEHTLVAFQAQIENRVNLYLLDIDDNTLTRLLPYAAPVTHNLFPRFKRDKKWLVYISDYTVAPWGRSTGAASVPDIPAIIEELDGMKRTRYPSPWVIKLEN